MITQEKWETASFQAYKNTEMAIFFCNLIQFLFHGHKLTNREALPLSSTKATFLMKIMESNTS